MRVMWAGSRWRGYHDVAIDRDDTALLLYHEVLMLEILRQAPRWLSLREKCDEVSNF